HRRQQQHGGNRHHGEEVESESGKNHADWRAQALKSIKFDLYLCFSGGILRNGNLIPGLWRDKY
ncbi:hypothetical protein, partial [Ralstonia pseudosolanacearum]|uniref:hypothetical protein n=1 Tax=Ralstonia pseudosolanacearum TaxID=1310165 RepID=UPI0032216952